MKVLFEPKCLIIRNRSILRSSPTMVPLTSVIDTIVQKFRPGLEDFSRRAWKVARKLFVLFAIILELDENYFVERHLYEHPSDDHLGYMQNHSRSVEDDSKIGNIWARGHTADFGSLTLLWSTCGVRTANSRWTRKLEICPFRRRWGNL